MKDLTREQMVQFLIDDDIFDIEENLGFGDTCFLTSVLSGEGWRPYNQLTDQEIETEYNGRN